MSAQTGIEWCDSTFNPWMGCTKVSPACDHCYAERDTKRFGRVEWGAGKARVRTSAANWKLPERWNRVQFMQCDCGARGTAEELGDHPVSCGGGTLRAARRRVFCASLADWLDNEVPIEWLVDLLDLIRRTPNLDWLLLTKRIGNFEARIRSAANHIGIGNLASDNRNTATWLWGWLEGYAPSNVWLGATVINQAEADRDVTKLLAVPARVRFLSIEPILGPVNLKTWIGEAIGASTYRDSDDVERCDLTGAPVDGIHWIIAGGESGPHARPSHPDWYRSLRDQCAAAEVPFLFKQWGEWANAEAAGLKPDVDLKMRVLNADGTEPKEIGEDSTDWECLSRYGKRAAGRLLDGRTHDGFPAVQP